jgi:hypothetical protein
MNRDFLIYVDSFYGIRCSDSILEIEVPDEQDEWFVGVDFPNGEGRVAVHDFFDVGDIKIYHGDMDAYSVPEGINPNDLIPFACDEGGNYIALERHDENIQIILYVMENTPRVVAVWGNVDAFVNNIKYWKYESDDIVQVTP